MKLIYSKLLLLCLSSSIISIHCDPQCSEDMKHCDCFANTGTIICDGEVTDKILKKELEKISGNWDLLHLRNTKVTNLDPHVFEKSFFEKIFIQNNDDLKNINPEAFGTSNITTDVVIRDNAELNVDNFKFLDSFKKTLIRLEMENNNIQNLNQQSFENFDKLESISLNSQNSSLRIQSGAFQNLKSLRELSLDGNKIVNISDNAIDLSNTQVPSGHQLVIYLNASNLSDDILKKEIIKLPSDLNGTIIVYLNHNNFRNLYDGLINTLIPKAYLIIDTENISCTCEDVLKIAKLLKETSKASRIHSIYYKHECSQRINKTMIPIVECPTTTTAQTPKPTTTAAQTPKPTTTTAQTPKPTTTTAQTPKPTTTTAQTPKPTTTTAQTPKPTTTTAQTPKPTTTTAQTPKPTTTTAQTPKPTTTTAQTPKPTTTAALKTK